MKWRIIEKSGDYDVVEHQLTVVQDDREEDKK